MVVAESEMKFQVEVDSGQQEGNKNHQISSLGRQASIYSLTLDEFQHTLCEGGKNFGSMNMDEFLTSIWSAEESQAINSNIYSNNNLGLSETSTEKVIRKQPSLSKQGSLTIPAPLYRKTVEEVWSEIHKGQQSQQQQSENVRNTESVPRQSTFGEMTLEDFLVKAGVVQEPSATMPLQASATAAAVSASSLHHHQLQQQQQQQYGMYTNNNLAVGPSSFVARTVMGGGNVVAPTYQAVAQGGGVIGGRVVNGGGGGFGSNMGVAAAPVSPVSPDGGLGGGENVGVGGQFGMEMGVLRGRKRMLDGPVEKVVERRQRRMIKNRESAARSRARKQAYTVELEAELNQLKEENAQLKLALAELERRRKQQNLEEVNGRSVETSAERVEKNLIALKRNRSCPLL